MTSSFIFLGLVCKFFRLLACLLDLPSQDDIRLNGLGQIQVPYFDFRQEGGYYGIVSFGRIGAID